ncbi:MAG: hypothetical protein QNM02_09430 [Acidimicrobiia bacterium]|nr:hypothetical protein [Acidimicrobiia bacterium]
MHATCGLGPCQVPFSRCRIHHVVFWGEHHGRTDEAVLIPVCEKHHHLLHEGGWSLEFTPDRVATWRMPDDSIYWTGATIDRHDNVIHRAA